MSDGLIWILCGLGLLGLELAAPGAFLMWIGLAAIGTGFAALAIGIGFALQVVVSGGLAAAAIAVALRLRKPALPPALNTQGSGLLGRTATVLTVEGPELRVRVGDSDWPARMAEGLPAPPPGAVLRVASVRGMMLVLSPIPG